MLFWGHAVTSAIHQKLFEYEIQQSCESEIISHERQNQSRGMSYGLNQSNLDEEDQSHINQSNLDVEDQSHIYADILSSKIMEENQTTTATSFQSQDQGYRQHICQQLQHLQSQSSYGGMDYYISRFVVNMMIII